MDRGGGERSAAAGGGLVAAVRRSLGVLGARLLRFLRGTGEFAVFGGRVIAVAVSRRPALGLLAEQMVAVGVRSLPLIFVVSAFVGMNMALQGHALFREVGGSGAMGLFVGLATVREMGPIVVGAMVASKAGSDMAAQIATMRLKSQIDALEVMAVDPLHYLMAPRFLAMIVMTPLLVVLADATLVVAATGVAVLQLQLNGALFLDDVFRLLAMTDIWYGMIKGLAFGVVISLLCCYQGFFADPSPEGVGRATNRAIVSVTSLAVLVNLLLSQLMYA
jgi:phospholipid/cholesterol/gamma-HCH transport system permease protein